MLAWASSYETRIYLKITKSKHTWHLQLMLLSVQYVVWLCILESSLNVYFIHLLLLVGILAKYKKSIISILSILLFNDLFDLINLSTLTGTQTKKYIFFMCMLQTFPTRPALWLWYHKTSPLRWQFSISMEESDRSPKSPITNNLPCHHLLERME